MKTVTINVLLSDGTKLRIVCNRVDTGRIDIVNPLGAPDDDSDTGSPMHRNATNIRVERQDPDGQWTGMLMAISHGFLLGLLAHAVAVTNNADIELGQMMVFRP